MREGMVICPKKDNAGHPLPHVRRKAIEMMVRAFGGCTSRDAIGHWRDGAGEVLTEPVVELVSAYEPGPNGNASLRQVARWIGEAAKQQAVYIRTADGEAELIDTAPRQLAA